MSVFTWSTTAASNGTADSSINWSEGQAPSTVNDSARAMMAALARYFGDISGAITTGGTTTAYTLTTNSGFDTLAHMGGQMIAFVPNQTNVAGSPSVTLAVDGLTAKPIRFAPSLEIPSGALILGTPYVVTYNNSDGAFYLQGYGTNPYQIPLGGMIPYTGATAPNSAFALPFGQAISRTTFSTYFSLVATAFGIGDGSTTFNVPDLRGRAIFGQDNMGGVAASRITNGGSSIVGTTIGAVGGGETITLITGNLPAYTPAGTINNATYSGLGFNSGGVGSGTAALQSTSNSGTLAIQISQTGGATFSGSAQGGTSTPLNKMPPCIIVPYILRVL